MATEQKLYTVANLWKRVEIASCIMTSPGHFKAEIIVSIFLELRAIIIIIHSKHEKLLRENYNRYMIYT